MAPKWFPREDRAWKREVEERLKHLDTAIQQLIKRIPQIPDPEAGILLTAKTIVSGFSGTEVSGSPLEEFDTGIQSSGTLPDPTTGTVSDAQTGGTISASYVSDLSKIVPTVVQDTWSGSFGTADWTNISNAGAENGAFADAVCALDEVTERLRFRAAAHNIPPGAVLVGCQARIKAKSSSAAGQTLVITFGTQSNARTLTTTNTWLAAIGGPTNKCGFTTVAEALAADVVVYGTSAFEASTLSVDACHLTIYYSYTESQKSGSTSP